MRTLEETADARDEFARRVTRGMAAGSEDAYREFYEAYFDRLFRHLLWATRGQEEMARDLLQQVLIRVVRYIEPFEQEARLWAWQKQIARSCHIDLLRRTGRRPETQPLELCGEQLAAPAEESNEWMEALDGSLAELEPDELQVVQRAYFEKTPQEEIAEEWNTSRKAVESRLARIRQKLKKLILEKLKDYALL